MLMWTLNCGCNPPYVGPVVFDIPDDDHAINNSKVKLPIDCNSLEGCLKQKIIKEFLDVVNKLECGIQIDLKNIIQNISLLDVRKYKDICC